MGALLSIIWSVIKGIFGFGGDSNVAERAAGEKLGQAESENAALKKYIETEQSVGRAGDAVHDDPHSVWNDPDNRSNPAASHGRDR